MRRVVTGEQVAQIYNPDPFARPVFRAPVYRTPAGIILIAWLVRGLARLLRLVFRHPVPALIVAVLAFLWVSIGWIGVTLLAAWAVLVLVIWQHYWPVGFGRWVATPAREQVAGLGIPPQVGRGHQHRRPGPLLPGPDHPAGAGQGHLHPVRRPGIRAARVRPVCG